MFAVLPDLLSRSAIRRTCVEAASSPDAATRAFLAVMAWGYGQVGYGPYRVQKILEATQGADARLQTAARKLASNGPIAGYATLGDKGTSQLPHLGPAFGTKYLYFCSPPERPALILDRLVAAWLRQNTDLRLNETRWSVHTYQRYQTTMYAWADEMGIASDDLEACIFSNQAKASGSQWAGVLPPDRRKGNR